MYSNLYTEETILFETAKPQLNYKPKAKQWYIPKVLTFSGSSVNIYWMKLIWDPC
jgi:hypothetical protein